MTAPSGISRIRRCKESGGLADEYCELHGEVVDDLVAIGRAPTCARCMWHLLLTSDEPRNVS